MSDWKKAAKELSEAFSTTDATPGGGSAAGVAGMIACALARMAAGISEKSSAKSMTDERRARLAAGGKEFLSEQAAFERLAAEDAAAFDAFMAAFSLPKDDPTRPEKVRGTLLLAADVPLETARRAAAAVHRLSELKTAAIGTVASDVNCALHLMRAAVLCALENVEINAASMKDAGEAARLRSEADDIRARLP